MSYPPSWLEEFVQKISYSLFPHSYPAPLGCHYHLEGETWEIALFPSMRETADDEIGAKRIVPSAFSFDVQQASAHFDDLQHLDWVASPVTEENEVGPHLLFEGTVDNETVLIRVCAEVPRKFQADPDLLVPAQ